MKSIPAPADLVQKAVAGDQAALTSLFEQLDPALRDRLRNDIPHRWRSVLSLDDLMQETYTDAFLDIVDFTPRQDGSFARWLITIAKHNLINAIQSLEAEKRGGKRRRVEPEGQDDSFLGLYELLGGTTTTPSRQAARHEAREALEQAIEQLPADYRLVVRMYDIEGHPVEVVSQTMKRSPGAVFMLRARAHRALRKLLGVPLKYFSDFA